MEIFIAWAIIVAVILFVIIPAVMVVLDVDYLLALVALFFVVCMSVAGYGVVQAVAWAVKVILQ